MQHRIKGTKDTNVGSEEEKVSWEKRLLLILVFIKQQIH